MGKGKELTKLETFIGQLVEDCELFMVFESDVLSNFHEEIYPPASEDVQLEKCLDCKPTGMGAESFLLSCTLPSILNSNIMSFLEVYQYNTGKKISHYVIIKLR